MKMLGITWIAICCAAGWYLGEAMTWVETHVFNSSGGYVTVLIDVVMFLLVVAGAVCVFIGYCWIDTFIWRTRKLREQVNDIHQIMSAPLVDPEALARYQGLISPILQDKVRSTVRETIEAAERANDAEMQILDIADQYNSEKEAKRRELDEIRQEMD